MAASYSADIHRRVDDHDRQIEAMREDFNAFAADFAVIKDNVSGIRRVLWLIFTTALVGTLGLLGVALKNAAAPQQTSSTRAP